MKISALAAIALLLVFFSRDTLRADDFPGLHEPLKTVTLAYLTIQQKLSSDTFDGVTTAAGDMKKVMSSDHTKTFALDFIKAVDDLAAAKDLHNARLAFQAVSNSLIAALAQNHVETGALHTVFCPMIKAYWVQTDGKTVRNPYYGASMLDCGQFQRQF